MILPIQYAMHSTTPEDEAAVLRALRSRHMTQGPEVLAFEEELAHLAGARYCVAVNSGTAALHLAYLAAGVKAGVTVSMPAISFVATANAARMCGADLHFWDCDPQSGLTIGGDWWDLLVVVTLGGQAATGEPTPGPVPATIIDACHGPIALPEGALVSCFSFHPAKHICAGEGGAIVTNDQGFADYCRTLRSHGRLGTAMWAMGFNYRMPEVCAALGRSQLQRYAVNVEQRRALAERYDRAFRCQEKMLPAPHDPASHRHLYQILLHTREMRDQVQARLKDAGIITAIHYPVIPHQPYYRAAGSWPGAVRYADTTLSLPLYPTLTEAEQDYVVEKVLEAVG